MNKTPVTIGAGEFKAKCLALLDDVANGGGSIVVTKRGKPVARVVAITGKKKSSLKGSVLHQDDIVAPLGESWAVHE